MAVHSYLKVGTRGSQMARAQTEIVLEQLQAQHPGLETEVEIITTRGDIDKSPIPLDTVGKDWFTKEIEQALLDKRIDCAVHSLKDLTPETPDGLIILPVLARNDPRDALIATAAKSLAELPQGAVVGTDSIRRKALLLQQRPDLIIKSLRGNADTRLAKLEAGEYDAIVLAAAGLERIGESRRITEYFDPTIFIPAVGQGTLAAECRSDDADTLRLLQTLQDPDTILAVAAEHAFSAVVGGGCKLPVGCYVHFDAGKAHIYGMVGSLDAKTVVTKSVSGPAGKALALAKQLAAELAKEPFIQQYEQAARQ